MSVNRRDVDVGDEVVVTGAGAAESTTALRQFSESSWEPRGKEQDGDGRGASEHHAERDGYVPLTLRVSFGQVRQVG